MFKEHAQIISGIQDTQSLTLNSYNTLGAKIPDNMERNGDLQSHIRWYKMNNLYVATIGYSIIKQANKQSQHR